MKKKIALLITVFLMVLSLSTALAEEMHCARGASDHDVWEHYPSWQYMETSRETCTEHSNCVVATKWYRRKWICAKCGYPTIGFDWDARVTHVPMNRGIEKLR